MNVVFTKSEMGHWIPGKYANGPFEGLHGGAVAGLLAAEIEQIVQSKQLGQVVSVRATFYRPIAMGKLRTVVDFIRSSPEASLLENSLVDDAGRVYASVRAQVDRVLMIALRSSTQSSARMDPSIFAPSTTIRAVHGGPWFMETMQARIGSDGTVWFKVEVPVIAGAGYLSRVLSQADWTHGIHHPLNPAGVNPTHRLSAYLIRPPVGEWMGIGVTTVWQKKGLGLGLGLGRLYDVHGDIGSVYMPVALAPLDTLKHSPA